MKRSPSSVMTLGRRSAKMMAAGICLIALGACSSIDLLYAFADDVVESRAKSFLDVSNPEDAAHLELAIDALFVDHTENIVPRISSYLNAQADALEANDLGEDRVAMAVSDFRALTAKATEMAVPYITNVLIRHTTPERINYLEVQLAERRAEREEEFDDQTIEEFRVARIKALTDGVERFIPDLTAVQVSILEAHVDAEIERNGRQRWLLNTERRHAALVAYLRTQPDEAALADYFYVWTTRSYEVVDPDYKPQSAMWWMAKTDLFYELANSMEDGQRLATIDRLRSYAADFAALTS